MTAEKQRPTLVDYDVLKEGIFIQANEYGPMGEIDSWKKAFPEVEFPEIDEVFSGEKLDWEEKTMTEMAFYVAYMKNPQAVEVKYEMEVEGVYETVTVKDSEKIWWMWLDGCFSGEELDERALRSFLWYANENNPLALKHIQDIDLGEVEIQNMWMSVAEV